MVVTQQDGFNKAIIYPHANGQPTINTAGNTITVTHDNKVIFDGREWQPEELGKHIAELKLAAIRAFEIIEGVVAYDPFGQKANEL